MNPEKPRPAAPGRAHRVANSKELPSTYDCQNSEAADKPQAGPCRERTPHAALVWSAALLALATSEKRHLAFAIGGPRAFVCPQTSAAFHEAGHCVVGAFQGKHPSKASIWAIIELGCVQWIGRTHGVPRWRVDDRTLPAADLQHA
jgi:hypothetical protein